MPALKEQVRGSPPNGHHSPTARSGWGGKWGKVWLTGDYDHWWAEMRLNPELRVWEDFSSGDDARFDDALRHVIRAWNLTDDDGTPIPIPSEGFEWTDGPFDLKQNIVNAYVRIVQDRVSPPKETSTPSEPASPSGT